MSDSFTSDVGFSLEVERLNPSTLVLLQTRVPHLSDSIIVANRGPRRALLLVGVVGWVKRHKPSKNPPQHTQLKADTLQAEAQGFSPANKHRAEGASALPKAGV